MSKVNLFFETFKDEVIEHYVKDYNIIRIKCAIQFKTNNGWSQPYSGIIDTGAHTSVIPLSIWKSISYNIIGNYKMFGIAKKEDCSIHVNIGKIIGIFVDEFGNQTNEIIAHAFLADTDKVPLIIGFRGFLEQFSVNFDFNNKLAFIDYNQ